jgi:UDP-glucose 4-epimerase
MSDFVSDPRAATAAAREAVRTVAVLGSTGFIGRAVCAELASRRVEVRHVTAPRLSWPRGLRPGIEAVPADLHRDLVETLARQLGGTQIVVNAAGIANPASPDNPSLYSANALLPVLVARACALAGVGRLIHVSSAAVQGEDVLDETARTTPFSPYSRSRALGEHLLRPETTVETVIFRPTSVHGAGRAVTRSLIRFARSPMGCTAGDGSAPTPQVLVEDVAAAVTHLALARGRVPPIVLQPHNGMTTGLLLRLLGARKPWHLPNGIARPAVGGLRVCAKFSPRAQADARRIDMLLFGRRQVAGWLAEQGAIPALRPEAWQRLAADSVRG